MIAIIAILAAILLPTLAPARERARGLICLSNTRQLDLAWRALCGRPRRTVGVQPRHDRVRQPTNRNWVNNVMTWDMSPTTRTWPRSPRRASARLCAARHAHLPVPVRPGVERGATGRRLDGAHPQLFDERDGGKRGHLHTNGFNINNPDYTQFFKLTQIRSRQKFLCSSTSNPDSMDDGYFIDRAYSVGVERSAGVVSQRCRRVFVCRRPQRDAPLVGARHHPPAPARFRQSAHSSSDTSWEIFSG